MEKNRHVLIFLTVVCSAVGMLFAVTHLPEHFSEKPTCESGGYTPMTNLRFIEAFRLVKRRAHLKENVLLCGDPISTSGGGLSFEPQAQSSLSGDGIYRISMRQKDNVRYTKNGLLGVMAHEFGHIALGHLLLSDNEKKLNAKDIEEQADAYAILFAGKDALREACENPLRNKYPKYRYEKAIQTRIAGAQKWLPYVSQKLKLRTS